MSRTSLRRTSLRLGFWACVCVFSPGCLALGIPSERLHDPADRGGLLGDWNSDVSYGPDQITQDLVEQGVVLATTDDGLFCEGPSPLDVNPKTGCLSPPKEKTPEVPWPRFHPVPTRPVFGTTP
ncbi:hypothetical protein [Rhodopirellula sallentina]|uniref:Signal peptide protein n=1 Tax=Rhodopirellula sallentina SM41 TaxID=1263870 RepID=M5U3B2_9BACT|nr:hypothetical protein [Rhodopirellula sallentina]EMI55945.1 signal peptide protein [Rhodopirellula sallentina SM41]